MKSSLQTPIKFILTICLLFLLGNTYSQSIKKNPSLFGKIVNTKKTNPNNGIIRCATVEYEKMLQEKNPNRLKENQFEAWISPMVSKYKTMRTSSKTAVPVIITIPVVVHVIYNGQAIGVAPNITDAQIQSQIIVLNQDFRKILGTNGENSSLVGADTEIQFELAKQDPNGNPTNGIDRVNLAQNTWSITEMDAIVKPKTIWDPTQYLNVWSVKFTEGNLLGYAQFPDGSKLEGLNSDGGDASSDGVVANYDVFGSNQNNTSFLLKKNYNLGRTMTHEVGHFLGLRHIWGDGNGDEYADPPVADCEASDYCADTPQAGWENYSCIDIIDSCPNNLGNDMVENYMDYTSDGCMNIFTIDQKARMTAVMNNSPRRSTLKTSNKNSAIPLFANDAELKFEISNEVASCNTIANRTEKKVIIFNRGTNPLTSATMRYTIDRGTNYVTLTWNGNLSTNQSATFPITISSADSGTVTISVLNTNNVVDERATNNNATNSFSVQPVPTNYTATDYIFTLQQDYFGSETTWNLSNSIGTILYSGGPYEDAYINSSTITAVPAAITKKFLLQNNQCYTFTIKDAFGDGICCGGTGLNGSGDGFYNLKTTEGTIVTSGSRNFEIESIAFTTNNTLGNKTFDTTNDILLYPNPTKEVLKIELLNNSGLLDSYTIYTSLGAKISFKKIVNQSDLTINTSSLNSGIYFITLEKDSAKKTLQFIKE